ncbi:MAG TPA: NAD(+)/NADH kinase [Chloroflexota bacterium]|nr:NAD(+)/NADH kinase [Chloroflexota bacterium]
MGAASVVDNLEKVNVVRRILAGLASQGVETVHYMPEHFGIVPRAVDHGRGAVHARPVVMPFEGRPGDTVAATERLRELGVAAIVVLGGDGTSRLVGSRSGDLPIVAVSTGTNNALPSWIDGTVAGIAAGLVARCAVPLDECAPPVKRLVARVFTGDHSVEDVALIDLAISRERFIAARAIWEPSTIAELFLTRAEPGAIGLSAIGAHLQPVGRREPGGLRLRFGAGGTTVTAPIVPGVVRDVAIRDWSYLAPDEPVELAPGRGVVALDGEREWELAGDARVTVTLRRDGPRVVEIRRTIELAARLGRFSSAAHAQE